MDMRTVIFSYAISNAVCAVIMALLWFRNRNRYAGLGFWSANFIMQFAAIVLSALYGNVPDFISGVMSDTFMIAGIILLLMGLERFVGRPITRQIHNLVFFAAFIFVHNYFTYIQPSVLARTINLSFGLIFICAQCAWLLMRRVSIELRPITRGLGLIFWVFCLIAVIRIIAGLFANSSNDFFGSGVIDTIFFLMNQMLFIILTINLLLMVDRRLITDLERSLNMEKLVENELRKLSSAVEQGQVSVVITDTNGGIEYVNPKFCEVSGYSFEDVRGQNLRLLRPVDESPEVDKELWEALTRGRKWQGTFRSQKKNGKQFWESAIISPIKNEQGSITNFLAVHADITEHKQMDEALQYRSKLVEALHQVTLELVNRYDMDDMLETLLLKIGVLFDAPDISIDLIEDNDILVTRAVTSDQPIKKGDIMRQGEGGWLSWQAIKTGKPAVLEDYSTWPQRRELFDDHPIHAIMIIPFYHGERVNGTINICRREVRKPFTALEIDATQKLAQITTLVLDNTQAHIHLRSELDESKRLVRVLHEGQENLQRYFNMGTVGMGIFSPEKRWMEANARLCQMLGYSTGELDELTWSELTHPDDLDMELKLFNDILLNKRDSYQLDKRFISKDSAVVYTSTYVSCYRNPNGTVPYFLASMVDITERKKGEESMLKLTVFEERQRLARNLHDSVNQSIHGLVLFSETLVSMLDKNNTERARQIAARLQESAFQALKETRLMLYEMQPADVERGVNFIQKLESRLLIVERHAGLRAQIIQEGSMEYCPQEWHENLFWITIESLNNALKHAQARKVQIIINGSPQRLTLEIVDDGIGFDPARAKSGGFGLRNMRERAGLLGGELTVDSTPGKGSRVHFSAEIK